VNGLNNRKIRIIFVVCHFEKWLLPIMDNWKKACNELQIETAIVGENNENLVNNKNFINSGTMSLATLVTRENLNKYNLKISNLDIEDNFAFVKRQGGTALTTKKQIQLMLNAWLNEALLMYKIIEPDAVVVWNGFLLKHGIYAKAAKTLDIPIFYAEKGMIPDTWYIDSKGINIESKAAKANKIQVSDEECKAWNKKLEEINSSGKSGWGQPRRDNLNRIRKGLNIGSNKIIILFAGQVDFDSNIILFSPFFKDSLDALRRLVETLPKEDFFILAKPHPKGNVTTKDFQQVLSDSGLAFDDINIIDAICLADCVVTINSAVAFEASVRGKPVLLLGQSVLSKQCFVENYNQEQSLLEQIKNCIKKYAENEKTFLKKATEFAAYLNGQYYINCHDYNDTLNKLTSVTNKISCNEMKRFQLAEALSFFRPFSDEFFERNISWKRLVKILFNKVLRRLKIKK